MSDDDVQIMAAGGYVIDSARAREQLEWAKAHNRANCFLQLFTQDDRCVMTIVDLYDEANPTKSVTNDAEYVVEIAYKTVLRDEGLLTANNTPIIYRDTEGRWDELRHVEGYFACYRSLTTKSRDDAIMTVLALHEQDVRGGAAS
jgi:hypothetical protein